LNILILVRLVKRQFGFRKNLANENDICTLKNEILNSLNNEIMVGSIFCDFEKAFDFFIHEILLIKLSHYGITGKAKSLFESYLKNIHQRVQITVILILTQFLNGPK
jgi:hypothetical protein